MPSESDLLNDALGQIGASSIVAIDDGSTNANYCLTFYPTLRDAILRASHWNFAMTRVQLAQDVTPPLYEFAYAYTLPSDCLNIVEYAGGSPTTVTQIVDGQKVEARYRIEGRKLYTNDGQAFLRYVRRVTNPDEFDPLFYQLVTTWLAAKLATAIMHDPNMSKALLSNAMNVMLPIAAAVDGQENSVEPLVVNDLTWGRR